MAKLYSVTAATPVANPATMADISSVIAPPMCRLIQAADRRPPTADRRPPTADRRPPTADRRPPTADLLNP